MKFVPDEDTAQNFLNSGLQQTASQLFATTDIEVQFIPFEDVITLFVPFDETATKSDI